MKLARTVFIGAFAAEASRNKCAANCKTDLKLSDADCQTGCKNVRNDCPDGIYPVPGEANICVRFYRWLSTSGRNIKPEVVFAMKPTLNLRSM